MAVNVEQPALADAPLAQEAVALVEPEAPEASLVPQWPERGLTMPDADEFFVVSSDTLTRLADSRTSWALNGLLAAIGLFGGTIVNAIAALARWPLDVGGLLNTLVAAGSLVGAVIFAVLVLTRTKSFTGVMTKIRAGKRYKVEGASLVPAKPKEAA